MWKWTNFYDSQITGESQLLRINIDETSLCVFQGDVKGCVFNVGDGAVARRQHVARQKRRRNVTLVACVCDDAAYQKFMPQYVIANAITFRAKDMAALRRSCPAGVVLVRQKSAWNNERVFCAMIKRIAASLACHRSEVQPVVIFDCARLHLTGIGSLCAVLFAPPSRVVVLGAVFQTCSKNNVWGLVLPPRLTARLQPLDTHVFHPFKTELQHTFQRVRMGTGRGDMDIRLFLQALYEAVQRILLDRPWRKAFEHNGLRDRQAGVAADVLRELEIAGPVPAMLTPPTKADIGACLPKNALKVACLVHRLFVERIGEHMAPGSAEAPRSSGDVDGSGMRADMMSSCGQCLCVAGLEVFSAHPGRGKRREVVGVALKAMAKKKHRKSG